MADFPAVNEVYATFFSDPKPVSEIQTLETGVGLDFQCRRTTVYVDRALYSSSPGADVRQRQVSPIGNGC